MAEIDGETARLNASSCSALLMRPMVKREKGYKWVDAGSGITGSRICFANGRSSPYKIQLSTEVLSWVALNLQRVAWTSVRPSVTLYARSAQLLSFKLVTRLAPDFDTDGVCTKKANRLDRNGFLKSISWKRNLLLGNGSWVTIWIVPKRLFHISWL